MVQKRSCINCNGTGLISVDFKYTVFCQECKGNGFHEIAEKQNTPNVDKVVLSLLHIVSQHTTSQQYEQILCEFNKERIESKKQMVV